jgi:hypothetical protein
MAKQADTITAKGALSDIGGFPIGLGHFWLILLGKAINVARECLKYLFSSGARSQPGHTSVFKVAR